MTGPDDPVVTTLVLVRHGVTDHTTGRRFSGGLGGSNPGLSDEGREQAAEVAAWLAPMASRISAVVSSPVRRTRETAEVVAGSLGLPVEEEPGFAEMEFGTWDGLSFAEVGEQHADDLKTWLGTTDVRPGGTGESFAEVSERVLAGLAGVLDRHAGSTVVVVSHVTPIKTLVADALGAPLTAVFRMELAPASVTVLSYVDRSPEERWTSMRLYNGSAAGLSAFGELGRW